MTKRDPKAPITSGQATDRIRQLRASRATRREDIARELREKLESKLSAFDEREQQRERELLARIDDEGERTWAQRALIVSPEKVPVEEPEPDVSPDRKAFLKTTGRA